MRSSAPGDPDYNPSLTLDPEDFGAGFVTALPARGAACYSTVHAREPPAWLALAGVLVSIAYYPAYLIAAHGRRTGPAAKGKGRRVAG